MTEEQASEALDTMGVFSTRNVDDLIRAAVAEEREVCAKIAEEYNHPDIDCALSAHDNADMIAAAIRARGQS